jgi:hypothetical protein
MLHNLCESTSEREKAIIDQNPFLTLSLEQAITAILFISSNRRRIFGEGLTKLRNREIHDFLTPAASIIEGWPERFYDFIESKCSQGSHPGGVGLIRQYGYIYHVLFRDARFSHSELDFFRKTFASYLELRGESHLANRLKLNSKYLSVREASARLGSGYKWLNCFISQGRLKTVVIEAWGKNQTFVESESIEKLREELNRLLDLKGAAKCLGVPTSTVIKLVHSGCLSPTRGPNVDGFRDLMFDRRDVEALITNIKNRLPDCDPLSKHCSDLRVAIKRFGPTKIRWGTKVRAILDGKLRPRKRALWQRPAPKVQSLYLPF